MVKHSNNLAVVADELFKCAWPFCGIGILRVNNSLVVQSTYQKHLGLYLDEKLNFSHHIKEKISKAYRGNGVIKKLQNNLPRQSLLTIYKSFIRPHLDYGDVVCDQPHNETFCSKLESVQYNAAIAIMGQSM